MSKAAVPLFLLPVPMTQKWRILELGYCRRVRESPVLRVKLPSANSAWPTRRGQNLIETEKLNRPTAFPGKRCKRQPSRDFKFVEFVL